MMRHSLFAMCLLFSLALHSAHAQDLMLLAGGLKQQHGDEYTYAWSLDYQHRLGDHSALGLTYLNEGHLDNHHRDGIAAQIRTRATLQPGFQLGAGVGPYYYFDTTTAASPADYRNEHGWGVLASLTATWHIQQRWFVQLRANQTFVPARMNTSSAVLGIGYRLDDTPDPNAGSALWSPEGPVTGHELTLSAGRTIVNSFNSERSTAASLEYRRGLDRHLDWTLAWLDEGDAGLLRRQGLVAQLWLVKPLMNERLALGAGAGPYLAIDRDQSESAHERNERLRLAALFTIAARYRVSPDFLVRASWSRVLTDYHRDTDVLLIGAGYAF